jgi:hypothetical protein
MEYFFLEEKPKSQFLVEFQSFLNKLSMGRFLAILGSYSQFWADFAALAMADSIPELHLIS